MRHKKNTNLSNQLLFSTAPTFRLPELLFIKMQPVEKQGGNLCISLAGDSSLFVLSTQGSFYVCFNLFTCSLPTHFLISLCTSSVTYFSSLYCCLSRHLSFCDLS